VTRILSLKTMLRCRDLAASRRFYVDLLGLDVVEEWNDPGDKGCIVGFGAGGGLLEMLAVDADHAQHQPAFAELAANDKIELQIRVDSVDAWAKRLDGTSDLEGPVTRPWGNRYLWLRDPDGVRVALFQGVAE
jgi:catechol 2,3-dioxygenase-like lactoylglutathione lyase family enzyme